MKDEAEKRMKYDLNHTFVTSDHHFRDWAHLGGVLAESTLEEERRHIELWNSVVGKDDLVLYIGDFCDGGVGDLEELSGKLNGRKTLIKGNHDRLGDEWYRCAFEDVVKEMRIVRTRASPHVRAAANDLQLDLRVREVAWLEAGHARGGERQDGRGEEFGLIEQS